MNSTTGVGVRLNNAKDAGERLNSTTGDTAQDGRVCPDSPTGAHAHFKDFLKHG
jgi:hypothetical protein